MEKGTACGQDFLSRSDALALTVALCSEFPMVNEEKWEFDGMGFVWEF